MMSSVMKIDNAVTHEYLTSYQMDIYIIRVITKVLLLFSSGIISRKVFTSLDNTFIHVFGMGLCGSLWMLTVRYTTCLKCSDDDTC